MGRMFHTTCRKRHLPRTAKSSSWILRRLQSKQVFFRFFHAMPSCKSLVCKCINERRPLGFRA